MYKKCRGCFIDCTFGVKIRNLEFSPEKLVAVLFSRKHKSREQFLKLGGKYIKHKHKLKYLGITLNRRLTCITHIKNKVDSLKGLLINITNKYKHTSTAKPKHMK